MRLVYGKLKNLLPGFNMAEMLANKLPMIYYRRAE